jgi:hyaluronan synthase
LVRLREETTPTLYAVALMAVLSSIPTAETVPMQLVLYYFNTQAYNVIDAWIDFLEQHLFRFLYQYQIYIPLGVIGFWRWSVWILKKTCVLFYEPIVDPSFGHNMTLAIITPVYNEDPQVFKKALHSWEINKPEELVAVIDKTDTSCITAFEEFSENKAWTRLIITSNPGKRPALADGIVESKSEIVALVDSDSIWAPNTKQNILAPFADPKVGGVTTRQHPIERGSIWQKITDIFWDMRNYYDLPSQAAMGSALSCLSGRTSAYRRKLIVPKLDLFLNEVIFGKKKESGEDKCLTRLIQQDGWKSYYQSNAVIYSAASKDFKTFWNQRIRWSRNSHNSDLVSLLDGWAWKHKFLAFCMVDRFISVFTIFLGPIFFAISIYLNQWTITLAIFALWMIGRGIKISPHLKRHPEDILILPLYVVITFLLGVAKLYALVTITEQRWIRTSKERDIILNTNTQARKAKDIVLTGGILCSMVLLVLFFLH